jgi:hypothetical protein
MARLDVEGPLGEGTDTTGAILGGRDGPSAHGPSETRVGLTKLGPFERGDDSVALQAAEITGRAAT